MKWSYNPRESFIDNQLDAQSKYLDLYSSTHEKVTILGGFNADIEEKHMKCFGDNYYLKSLIKQANCFKNLDSPSCIDLFLINAPRSFQRIRVLETGLSDFQLMTLSWEILSRSYNLKF